MTSTIKITCRRCKGTGFTKYTAVYAGAPGTCFACAGAGEVYKDKFYRKFGVGKTFYGVTWSRYHGPENANNGVYKLLYSKPPLAICEMDYRGFKPAKGDRRVQYIVECVEISEEQARQFWTTYGTDSVLGGVRVSDFDGRV